MVALCQVNSISALLMLATGSYTVNMYIVHKKVVYIYVLIVTSRRGDNWEQNCSAKSH